MALLVNAVEAMPDGGTLTVKMRSDDEALELSVRDTGVGIPEEIRPHIFEPFVSTKWDTKGVGLGLAIVRAIVRAHRGTVDVVESTPGKGSVFRISLPRPPRAATGEVATTAAVPVHPTTGSP